MKLFVALAVTVLLLRYDEGVSAQKRGKDDNEMFLPAAMRLFYKQYDGMTEENRNELFLRHVQDMDINKDTNVTFEELHAWALKHVENEASSQIDMNDEAIMSMDKNKDGKFSWEDISAHYSAIYSDIERADGAVARELEKVKVRFTYADENNDGSITNDEMPRMLMPENFISMQEMFVDIYMIDRDIDRDGKISEEEFYADQQDPKIIDKMKKEFQLSDVNKDGILTKDEVRDRAVEDKLSKSVMKRELEHIWKKSDSNGDGVLSYDELVHNHNFFTNKKIKLPKEVYAGLPKDEL